MVIFAFTVDNRTNTQTVTADGEKGFHIVLDAGHGGKDQGAIVGGIKEAEINLQIVKKLQTELLARGIAVSLTRSGSDSLSSPFALNKKKDDMAKRRELIKKLSPDLVISIHQNTYPSPNVYGLQCFYATETAGSLEYAEMIQKQFNDSGLITYKSVKKTDFNLCEHSSVPAVLIECGFLSNPTERKLLVTDEYQQILAWNIAVAVSKTANKNTA
jgi:N-acetylmuramoyl-L-alanine amidase